MVTLASDPDQARSIARQSLGYYWTLPNYTNNLRRLGFAEDDFAEGGSQRLLDALVAWGSPEDIAARVRAHRDAGANHVCIQPLHPGGQPLPDYGALTALAG